jgi:hypothetical protein
MARSLDILAAAGLIVLCAPLLVLAWLGLKLQGVRPSCVRGDGNPDSPAGFRRFNVRGDDLFSRFMRRNGIDQLPFVFDLLAGTTRLADVIRDLKRTFAVHQRPFTKREQLARGLILLIATAIIVVLSYFFWQLGP